MCCCACCLLGTEGALTRAGVKNMLVSVESEDFGYSVVDISWEVSWYEFVDALIVPGVVGESVLKLGLLGCWLLD